MDASHCPPGFYTDRAFQRPPLAECATPIWLYWALTMTMCMLRFAAFFKKIDNHMHQKTSAKQYPVSLIVHCFAAIMYVLVAVLVGLNIANVDNGTSFSLYSLAYISFIINYSVLLLRTVRLGQRLIPKGIKVDGDLNFLTKFTHVGLLMVAIQSVCAAASCIALVFITPIIPEREIILGVVGFATKGVFQMLCVLGIVMQFERCIRALRMFKSQSAYAATLGERESKLSRTIRIMRRRQITIFVFGIGVSFLYIIFAAEAVPWTWFWIILGTAGPETCGSIIIEFCFTSNSRKTGENSQTAAFQSTQRREDMQVVSPAALQQLNAAPAAKPQDQPNHEEHDEVKDLPSIESKTYVSAKSKSRYKRGPMGFRLKRKPKLELDLTKVTEEQTYVSSINPRASDLFTAVSNGRSREDSTKGMGSSENNNSTSGPPNVIV